MSEQRYFKIASEKSAHEYSYGDRFPHKAQIKREKRLLRRHFRNQQKRYDAKFSDQEAD